MGVKKTKTKTTVADREPRGGPLHLYDPSISLTPHGFPRYTIIIISAVSSFILAQRMRPLRSLTFLPTYVCILFEKTIFFLFCLVAIVLVDVRIKGVKKKRG